MMIPSRSVLGAVHNLPLWCGWRTVKSPHLGELRNVGGATEAGTPELHRVEARRQKWTACSGLEILRWGGVEGKPYGGLG